MTATDLDRAPNTLALEECIAVNQRWMHLPDPGVLLVALATVVANRGPGDPVWLLIVGPPGGGKTETVMPLAAQDDVHPAATLTEAALLSGTPKKEHEGGAKGGLLRVIGRFGIILSKDFTSVLSMNRDARSALLAALREIYDGSWTRHVGTGGGRTLAWDGKVGFIAGCTPAIDSHHAVMGSMGERFVLYRITGIDGQKQAACALEHLGHETTMRDELAAAASRVLDHADTTKLVDRFAGSDHQALVALAELAARCRSSIERDPHTREITLIPEPEAPARIALVLLRIHNALIAIGTDHDEAWRLVTKVALDSMPAVRRTVLDALADWKVATASKALAELIGYPNTTTMRTLQELAAHGVVTRHGGMGNNPDEWEMSDWASARWPKPEKSEDF